MEIIGSIYTEVSDNFQKGIIGGGVSRCVKAEKHDLGVVLMNEVKEFMTWGCSPTLSTMQGGNQEPKILESQIVAMRGRNPDNPSDRTVGSPIKQRLEVNMQGTSNCLTSVQKDNMVLESVLAVDEQNMNVRKETFGTLTTNGSSPKHNNRVMIKQATKLTAQNQVVRIEKVGQISSDGSQCGTVISDNGISANLVAGTHGYANSHIATQYRIRKLTPKECGRLMGVSDEDINKMAAVNSNTQLYKQFGNSIVVDVMCAMFKNLNIKQGDRRTDE